MDCLSKKFLNSFFDISDSLYNKTKIFDKTGIFGIGKSEMSKKEFKSFFDKQSIHYGY